MKIVCKTELDLAPAAVKLLNTFPDARIFAFYGKMGAGKTTFIKAICAELKVLDVVASPTFAIVSAYNTDGNEMIYHFDFYRIKKLEEVFDIGYEEYFFSGEYCFVEWPEMIEPLLPDGTVKVKISGDEERTIEF